MNESESGYILDTRESELLRIGVSGVVSTRITPDAGTGNLVQNTVHATFRDLEGARATAQKTFKAILEESRKNMDNVLKAFNTVCENIRKSTDNDIRKEIKAVLKDHSKRLLQIEKDSTQAIRVASITAKDNLQNTLDSLGKHSKDLDRTYKDIKKFLDRLLEDFIKMIREYNKMLEAQMKDNSLKYIKNVYLVNID